MSAFVIQTAQPPTTGIDDDSKRCGYASRRCENPRVVKRDGELHRFCNHHRRAAKRNQQRLQQKQRQLGTPSTDLQNGVLPQQLQRRSAANALADYASRVEGSGYCSSSALDLPVDLDEDDLRALEVLVMDDDFDLLEDFDMRL